MSHFSLSKLAAAFALGAAVTVPTMLPTNAQAAPQSHKQKNKNNWRNLGYAGAALGGVGLITHNKTLAIGGLAGGAYSAYRYEQDRKGQSRARSRRSARHHSASYYRAHRRHH